MSTPSRLPPGESSLALAESSARRSSASGGLGHVQLFGSIGVHVHDWSRPVAGRSRLFDQRWLERLSCVHPVWIPLLFLPPAAMLTWSGVVQGLSATVIGLLFLVGVVCWSLTEYMVHRFVFHFTPSGRTGIVVAYLLHGIHHAFPEDDRRWVLPPPVSIPIALALYALCRLSLGALHGPFFAGFLVGYVCYDLLHYQAHRRQQRSRFGQYLRAYHLTHHYATPDRHFGISSPLWDYFFGTVEENPRDQ